VLFIVFSLSSGSVLRKIPAPLCLRRCKCETLPPLVLLGTIDFAVAVLPMVLFSKKYL
jgi:hypothetical protein